MYDQTGSTDSDPGFRPNPNGFNSAYSGFQGQAGQGFNADAFNQFRSSFSGFNSSQRGMGGFEDLFGNIFGNRAG